jgi:hypothetical protein
MSYIKDISIRPINDAGNANRFAYELTPLKEVIVKGAVVVTYPASKGELKDVQVKE